MHNLNITKLITLALLLTACLMATACSSGGTDPLDPGPGGNANNSLGTLSGQLVDREGFAVGGFDTTISVTNEAGISVGPKFSPPGSGPEAGMFLISNLPVGQKLFFKAEHVDQSAGRFLGFDQTITFSAPGTLDLGKVMLDNAWLELAWNSYKQKDYTQSLIYFDRALKSRSLSATGDDFTRSSSAYTGMGWVHAKRGKDNQGNFNPMFPGFEWDEAIGEFDDALANIEDADAWVGRGGTKLSLLGNVSDDPVQIGPYLPIYGLSIPYFSDAYQDLQKALVIDSSYNCQHDLIKADDLRATQLFLTWVLGGNVTLNEIESYSDNGNINFGTMEMLAVMPDLILYQPYPQR